VSKTEANAQKGIGDTKCEYSILFLFNIIEAFIRVIVS
jgi:hypothetical protein